MFRFCSPKVELKRAQNGLKKDNMKGILYEKITQHQRLT